MRTAPVKHIVFLLLSFIIKTHLSGQLNVSRDLHASLYHAFKVAQDTLKFAHLRGTVGREIDTSVRLNHQHRLILNYLPNWVGLSGIDNFKSATKETTLETTDVRFLRRMVGRQKNQIKQCLKKQIKHNHQHIESVNTFFSHVITGDKRGTGTCFDNRNN